MIIKLNTAQEVLLTPLFQYLKKESPYFHYLEDQHIIIAPKFSKSLELQKYQVVSETIDIDTPYQLASHKWKKNTQFQVKNVAIGAEKFNIIAGPCSIESEEQIFQTAAFLNKLGIKFIRGGAYKPRTSPYSFQGLKENGLSIISEAAKQYDLRVVTEIMDISLLDTLLPHADILQVGSRNMQNFFMLNELGKVKKPVMLKRGMNAKVTEWLLAAEYMLAGGNEEVVLCERGIRSFDPESRNVMDVGVIPLIKELSHLPIIADPSHGTGAASRVTALSLASAAAGANGLMIELHPDPKKALSDSAQALSFDQFETLLGTLTPLLNTLNIEADINASALKLQTL